MNINAYLVSVLGHSGRDKLLASAISVHERSDLPRTVLTTTKLPCQQAPTRKRDMARTMTYALKLVMVAVKLPLAAAVTAVEVSIPLRAALPQGFAVDGRWTSLRAGVP